MKDVNTFLKATGGDLNSFLKAKAVSMQSERREITGIVVSTGSVLCSEVLVAQSCWLCNPRDCSPPGSSVFGILPAIITEWVAVPFSTGFSWARDWTRDSHIVSRFFTVWATREAHILCRGDTKKSISFSHGIQEGSELKTGRWEFIPPPLPRNQEPAHPTPPRPMHPPYHPKCQETRSR